MPRNKNKKSLSQLFNNAGERSMENAISPVFISTMIVLGLCTLPFSVPMTKMILSLPTISYGSGFLLKKVGQGMTSINNRLKNN